ncbi:MAG: hypothetical protein CVU34_19995 [Betaproteobacteria bacterium HGW-Betaproteobacteria-7]|jgi:cellobiose phosphorylase|nr:MAG: hypothetical protein CVU34_19995 [Betaproteobacteria bacterium HGW-Betaproteobacteria-7]
MLAPLKDRNLIERESSTDSAETPTLADLQAENMALRLALRQARRSQRRSATLTARQIVTLNNEMSRLQQLNLSLQQQCEEYASGQAIVSIGQRLMVLEESNEQLLAAAQQVWYLDKSLCAAHHECERLARERDAAICCLRTDLPHRPN